MNKNRILNKKNKLSLEFRIRRKFYRYCISLLTHFPMKCIRNYFNMKEIARIEDSSDDFTEIDRFLRDQIQISDVFGKDSDEYQDFMNIRRELHF